MLNNIKEFLIVLVKKIYYLAYLHTEKVFSGRISKYDFETFEIIKRFKNNDINCIDIGANKGYILKCINKKFKKGKHFAIEPIKYFANKLKKKYKKVTIFNTAVSDYNGNASFTYFPKRHALSGLYSKKLHPNIKSKQIDVKVKKLDDLIPKNTKIGFVKIDVESAEYSVLKGAKNTIINNKPLIIFEFSVNVECNGEKMYDLISSYGLKLSLMEYYLKGKKPLNKMEFIGQAEKGYNSYFIAYP